MVISLEKLTEEQIKHFTTIANQHNENIDEKKGFLFSKNYEEVFKNATRTYVDHETDPAYILIIYNNDDFEKHHGKLPKIETHDLEGLCHSYAVFKNKNKKANYKNFLKEIFETEKNKYQSNGMWVLISEEPYENKKSKDVHGKFGYQKIGEHSTQSKNQLNDKPIKWGVFVKKYI